VKIEISQLRKLVMMIHSVQRPNQMKCGMARIRRKKTVSRLRR
jgi:hypothetical protein